MSTSPYKAVTLRPLTGPLDSRSNPEDVPPLSFRLKLNFDIDLDNKLSRAPGWEKLLSRTPYVNHDAHDQGDCLDVNPVREPITFLYEATSSFGIRRLLRGTQSSLAVLSESTGQWTTVARGFGGTTANPQVRWMTAQSGNTLIFTNNFDKPQSYAIGTLPAVCGDNVVKEIPELNTLKVTRAGVVASFSGCVFLMDVTQEGSRFQSRVRWSGVNDPTRWMKADDTVAGFQDLPYTETILAAAELQGSLWVFTTASIYRVFVSGNSFGFTRVYTEPKARARCLVYPQTLVSDGESLWYFGRSELYRIGTYDAAPVIEQWLWGSSNLVFTTLATTCCAGPVGAYDPVLQMVWWSWPKADSGCLNFRTLKVNLRAQTASIQDAGWTAFTNFRSDERQTLNEWLDDVCDTDFIGLCATIGSKRVEEFCTECSNAQLFVAASSDDYCLKQMTGFAREICTNAATGEGGFAPNGSYQPFTGQYVMDGYFSVIRGTFPFGHLDHEKSIKQFTMDTAVEHLLGKDNFWRLRIGTSYQSRDPNASGNPLAFAYDTDGFAPEYEAEFTTDGGDCAVLWHRYSDKALQCPNQRTVAQYAAAHVRPNRSISWGILSQGRFLAWEISVISKDAKGLVVAPVGAVFTISSISVQAKVLPV